MTNKVIDKLLHICIIYVFIYLNQPLVYLHVCALHLLSCYITTENVTELNFNANIFPRCCHCTNIRVYIRFLELTLNINQRK